MQFRKGALVPLWGNLYRVVAADVFNGHQCYQLEDPDGVNPPIAHAQHTEVVATIERMAMFKWLDRFRTKERFGDQWVKERKWNSRTGTIVYRLADYWDEQRAVNWITQEELCKLEHVGSGLSDPKGNACPEPDAERRPAS